MSVSIGGFACFTTNNCVKCGRTSVRDESPEEVHGSEIREVCLGCNKLVQFCACPDVKLLKGPSYQRAERTPIPAV